MLLHDVTNMISSQITGETRDRYLRLLNHGEKFRDSIQVVSADVFDGIVYICLGGRINPGVSVSMSFSDEDPYSVVLDRTINQLVDEYCAVFNAQFEHSTLKL